VSLRGFGARVSRRLCAVELGGFAVATVRGPERLTVLRSAIDGVKVHRTLNRTGVRPHLRGRGHDGQVDVDRARRVSGAVDAGLGVLPTRSTCLRRSVTLLREMDRLGLEGTMHIGVRRDEATMSAHAWVQVGKMVVNDDNALVARYAEISVGDVERLMSSFT
jgi:hypothetical protein